MKQQWSYDIGGRSYIWRSGVYDSREEAIKAALEEKYHPYGGYNAEEKIYIAKTYPYIPRVDGDYVCEYDAEQAFDECGEVAEDYLDNISTEAKSELSDELTKVYIKWLKKHNGMPTFWQLGEAELIDEKEIEGVE